MKNIAKASLALLVASTFSSAQAGALMSADTVPYAPVLAKALASVHETNQFFLRVCAPDFRVNASMNRLIGTVEYNSNISGFIASQLQTACGVAEAETALLNSIAGKTYPSVAAQQEAADAAARKLNINSFYGTSCTAVFNGIKYLDGSGVQADVKTLRGNITYSCDATKVTLAKDGQVFFTWSPEPQEVAAKTQQSIAPPTPGSFERETKRIKEQAQSFYRSLPGAGAQ